MQALRIIAKPENHKITIDIPSEMMADSFEVIVLENTKQTEKKSIRRKPPVELKESEIYDDLIEPAVSVNDWEVLK